ncbi:hypothetical protein BH10PLA1_BH10PLA1_10470 [soil metagenome]
MAFGCLVGCVAPREKAILTDDIAINKIPAISIAVQKKDLHAAKQMVKDLDSEDPAVRFYSIQGLRRLTGQTFDYVYYDDAMARQPSVKRWQEWLATQNTGK